jgi:hypothetical protein
MVYYIYNQPYCFSGSKVKNKEEKFELQILVSCCNAEEAFEMYRMKWQIETMHRYLKSNGFEFEGSHVRNLECMSNPFSIIMIACEWCYLFGIYFHENIKLIKVLKYGREGCGCSNKACTIFHNAL